MQTFSSKGRNYRRVPEIAEYDESTGECFGCVASTKTKTRGKLCNRIFAAMNEGKDTSRAARSSDHFEYCGDTIWIRDNQKGMAEYIALKLEKS